MTSTYISSDYQIKNLPPTNKKVKLPISKNSSLYLIQHGQSKNFVGRRPFPPRSGKFVDVRLGKWDGKNTIEKQMLWKKIKTWHEQNPLTHPREFFKPKKTPKTLGDAFNAYTAFLQETTKEKTWRDRINKIEQMKAYLDENSLLEEYEITNGGRAKVIEMMETLFFSRERYYQGKRCRGLLKQIFDFSINKGWMGEHQNPAIRADDDEKRHKKRGNVHIKWTQVPELMKSINGNACNGSKLVDLALKAHLLLVIRVGVVVRLEWDWYQPEQDVWIIPSQTPGLKNKLGDEDNDHIIPSTPEIQALMDQLRPITGWQKYVFYSNNSQKFPHLNEETPNDHLKNLGWHGKQSAHGWRDVFVEGCQENDQQQHIIERCMGHRRHKQGSWGHYDDADLLEKRRTLMKWWTRELVNQGLAI